MRLATEARARLRASVRGARGFGQLLAFAAFLSCLYPPVRALGRLGLTVSAATAGAERLPEILDARPAVTDPPARTVPSYRRARGGPPSRRSRSATPPLPPRNPGPPPRTPRPAPPPWTP
ncbi:hypothetical protein [Streptomyces endophytica]|uniref:hypothetical protein n=1 Tax=Streptomyces endophytica TaxID=2991496 RepID=UPI003C704CE6